MVGFSEVCVGVVILMAIIVVTFLIGGFLSWLTDDDFMEFGIWLSWLFSSVGFAICLTILLIDRGVI